MTSRTKYPDQSAGFEQVELDRLLSPVLAPVAPATERNLAMAARLRQRTLASMAEHAGLLTVRLKDGVWRSVTNGIRFKTLWNGPAGNSVLIEFAAGASLPVHRHNRLEEGIVLRGGLQMGELDLGVFDYHVSAVGSRHQRIQSRQGALAYLRGTSLGHAPAVMSELLGGLLPLGDGKAQTVFFGDDGWQALKPGVFKKTLYSDGRITSCFYRLEPGATVPAHQHVDDEECMMLAGEIFLGDILLRAGEYQLAPAGTTHREAYTDVGALLFVRGAVF